MDEGLLLLSAGRPVGHAPDELRDLGRRRCATGAAVHVDLGPIVQDDVDDEGLDVALLGRRGDRGVHRTIQLDVAAGDLDDGLQLFLLLARRPLRAGRGGRGAGGLAGLRRLVAGVVVGTGGILRLAGARDEADLAHGQRLRVGVDAQDGVAEGLQVVREVLLLVDTRTGAQDQTAYRGHGGNDRPATRGTHQVCSLQEALVMIIYY